MSMIRIQQRKSLASLKSQSELLPIVLIVILALNVAVAIASQNMTGMFASNGTNLLTNTASTVESNEITLSPTIENETTAIATENTTSVSSGQEEDTDVTHTESIATSPQISTNEADMITQTENITLNESVEIILNETNQTSETNGTAPEMPLNETDKNTTIPDALPPSYSNFAVNNTNPEKDEAVEFSAFWQDDFGLDKWIFSWNASGFWENETHSFVSSYDENTQILTRELIRSIVNDKKEINEPWGFNSLISLSSLSIDKTINNYTNQTYKEKTQAQLSQSKALDKPSIRLGLNNITPNNYLNVTVNKAGLAEAGLKRWADDPVVRLGSHGFKSPSETPVAGVNNSYPDCNDTDFNFVNSTICSDNGTLYKVKWKYLKDLNYEDEVATLSGKKIEWEKPIRIISLPYDNGIYEIDGEIDLLVTPDHQVYTRIDNDLSFLVNRIKDFFFGIDIEDFRLIGIIDAYDSTKNGYHLTFLDDKLKPVYVSKLTKQEYKGEIFDLTVPNHIVLVKRFGKAVWSSNLNVKEAWSNVTKVIPVVGLIDYRFYASDLAGNWKETEIGTIEVKEADITQPVEVLNQSLLTIKTDKSTYYQNETVNVSGEILVNGTKADNDADLNVLFNQTPQKTQKIKAMSGSYSYSFLTDFGQEGEYLVKVSVENLTNSTSFYYHFSNVSEIILSVSIEYPQKITRGEIIEVKATITNTGSIEAKDVLLTWKLPEGFEIISGTQTESCGTLESNTSCVSVITVQTSLSTELGINEIKVVVNYE